MRSQNYLTTVEHGGRSHPISGRVLYLSLCLCMFLTSPYCKNSWREKKHTLFFSKPSLPVESTADKISSSVACKVEKESPSGIKLPVTTTSAAAFTSLLFLISPGLVMKYSGMLILVMQISFVLF